MENLEILEGKKLIAEYMEFQTYSDGLIIEGSECVGFPAYDSSWDLLMPVVGKISAEAYQREESPLDDCDGYSPFIYEGFRAGAEYNDIETVFKAVVEYIQWDNTRQFV